MSQLTTAQSRGKKWDSLQNINLYGKMNRRGDNDAREVPATSLGINRNRSVHAGPVFSGHRFAKKKKRFFRSYDYIPFNTWTGFRHVILQSYFSPGIASDITAVVPVRKSVSPHVELATSAVL
jgi:hypothetical protein